MKLRKPQIEVCNCKKEHTIKYLRITRYKPCNSSIPAGVRTVSLTARFPTVSSAETGMAYLGTTKFKCFSSCNLNCETRMNYKTSYKMMAKVMTDSLE